MRTRLQLINGVGSGDIERAEIGVAPSEIGGLLGHGDCAEMVSLGIPYPDALGSGDV